MNEFYTQLTRQLQALTQDSPVLLSNLSNAAALLYQSIPDINWAGFYLARDRELLLGPFGGKPACLRIPFEKGVCGQAARSLETVVVPTSTPFRGISPATPPAAARLYCLFAAGRPADSGAGHRQSSSRPLWHRGRPRSGTMRRHSGRSAGLGKSSESPLKKKKPRLPLYGKARFCIVWGFFR